jgi:hypothetical protein
MLMNTPPPITDNDIDKILTAAGTNGERVRQEDVTAAVKAEYYFTALEGAIGSQGMVPYADQDNLAVLTFCVLVLQNGYTVYGTSATANLANYNADLGRKLAKQKALGRIWPLLGYVFKEYKSWGKVLDDDALETTRQQLAKLEALESAGVDNWEGYDEAMALLRGEELQ